jgi:hypothetical protein
MTLSSFLRAVLKLDAASCLGMAAIILAGSASMSGPLGVESPILQGAALSLIPIGLFILWLGIRREAPAVLVYLVIVGNAGWAAASLAAAFELPGITPLGTLLVAGQGLAVFGLAMLEWIGVRQSSQSTAHA